jgi:hypothetical protein
LDLNRARRESRDQQQRQNQAKGARGVHDDELPDADAITLTMTGPSSPMTPSRTIEL